MNDVDRFKMVDPEMDIRRLAKKLFPNLWVHHGVISNVPPSGPMSPARVTDMAERMSAAVLVFSHTLRPVLQYYLEKHSSAMEGSKILFWTHLAFLCLRIRLRRDHLFDYFLNATAVVAECALSCGGRLDDVHAWSATFFCAFFEHELIGPFYSAGGWAGLMNYVQESDLLGVFERLVPRSLVAVASESLSAERRERIAAARSLRGDEIERFEPAKILAAKIFHWDFSEKFPMSPLAPRSFKRTPNIRRKTRSKSESAHTKMRLCHIDVEPGAASSAPQLRYIDEAKPGVKRVHTQRSISVDVKAKLSEQKGPYIPLHLQSDHRISLEDKNNETSSVHKKSEATSEYDLRRSYDSTSSLSVYEPICSPKTSFKHMKCKSPPKMLPKLLFPISMDEDQATENLLTLKESKEGNSGVEYASNDSRHRRFSLPNSNRRTLIDTMQEKNPAVFQTFIWKDDFTLRKSKQTKDQLSVEEDDHKNKINDQNKNCDSMQKKTFSFEDIHSIYTEEPVRKNSKVHQCSHWRTSYESMASIETDDKFIIRKNPKVHQCSHWRTSFDSMASVETDVSSITNMGNPINLSDDSKSETDDIGKLVAKLLLTNVTDDPYTKEDNYKIGAFSFNKNEQIYAKSPNMNATTLNSSYGPFEEEDTESMVSISSSELCHDFKHYKMSQNSLPSNVTGSYNSMSSFPSILTHSEFKSSDDRRISEREDGKSLSDDVKMRPKTKLSPSSSDKSDCDDKIEKVVIYPDTQTVLYKKGLLGSLVKRVRKRRDNSQSETSEKGEMDSNPNFRIANKKEKDSKKISDIKRALKNSGVPNPAVFKI